MGRKAAIYPTSKQRCKGMTSVIYWPDWSMLTRGQVQEAALGALGSLAQDNSVVALILARPMPDKDKPGSSTTTLQTVLNLCKSRTTDVSLAACLW